MAEAASVVHAILCPRVERRVIVSRVFMDKPPHFFGLTPIANAHQHGE